MAARAPGAVMPQGTKRKRATREWKEDLGFDPSDVEDQKKYNALREELKSKLLQLNIRNKTTAGRASREEVRDFVGTHRLFPNKGFYNSANERRQEEVRAAVNEFMLDCTKKLASARGKNKYAYRLNDAGDAAEEVEVPVIPQEGPGGAGRGAVAFIEKPVRLILVDPDLVGLAVGLNIYDWNWGAVAPLGHTRSIATLKEPTIEEAVAAFSDIVPPGRSLRIIWGAMDTPAVGGAPIEQHELISDPHINAFLMMTASVPIVLQGILHRAAAVAPGAAAGAQSPPPPNRNYYEVAEAVTIFEDAVTDSEEDNQYWIRKRKKMRNLPRRDDNFEALLEKQRTRVVRQATILRTLKAAHKKRYPDAIHSDDEGWKTIQAIGNPKARPAKRESAIRKYRRRRLDVDHIFVIAPPAVDPDSSGADEPV